MSLIHLWLGLSEHIAEAADRGRVVDVAVTKDTNVSRSGAARLEGQPQLRDNPKDVGLALLDQFSTVLGNLARLPSTRRPATASDPVLCFEEHHIDGVIEALGAP